jgi:hypothetical protein
LIAELLIATRGGGPSYAATVVAVADLCELRDDFVGVASGLIVDRRFALAE